MKRALGFALVVAVFCGCSTTKVDATTHATPPVATLKVGVYADRGPGGIGAVEWFRLVEESPDMQLKLLDGASVRAGGLSGLDVLVMPGGSSMAEFESLGTNGVAKMKDFIRKGGGYIGTCAGCCLLMDGPKKRANVIPWNTKGSEPDLLFPRFKLTDAGRAALNITNKTVVMRYHGGPFMWPTTNKIEGANFELWGTFDSEATFKGSLNKKKSMYGAAAIVGGTYGKGRVFVTAAHPEYWDSTLFVVKAAFKYVTGCDVEFPVRCRTPRAISVGFLAKGISGVATAETALALAREQDFDLVLIDKDGIFMRRMDNIDVLVVTSDVAKSDKTIAKAVKAFAARGGKVVAYGSGVRALPEGGIACEPREGVVRTIHALFSGK